MIRSRFFGACVASVAMFALALSSSAAGDGKSDSQVKAKATAGKIENGVQNVTITLDIAKGWHLYANPVNHKKEFLDGAKTKVSFAVKGTAIKAAKVTYPAGTPHIDKDDSYDIYAGTVKIEAKVPRAAGDTNPLDITIDVQACDDKVCLAPGKVKVTVP